MRDNRTYIVEQDEVETPFRTAEQALEFIRQTMAGESVDLWVFVDCGVRPNRLRRLFGFSERSVTPCFQLQKCGDTATLTFLDEHWSEYRALDPHRPAAVRDEVRRRLSGGELTPADPEECMTAARALDAARDFLLNGSRPDWLSYRYVR